jgi:methylenetetrahydrofolate dehydrogenase (NADP+)/methenyltetrahydrofolate cyclohydrolase
MKSLNGSELVSYIKERQARDVRSLKQSKLVNPKLAIIRTNPDPVVDSYMRIKQGYGDDIGVIVDVHSIDQPEAIATIRSLATDDSVHGIIVQIPLPDISETDAVLNAVPPHKDVDGLAKSSEFDAPTPMAINWLLAGYNIVLEGKKIVIVGHGRLVGRPLEKLLKNSGYNVEVADKNTEHLEMMTSSADILVCATGVAGLITDIMVKPDAVIIDAGVATDKNGLVGDVAPSVRELPDIKITPEKGGVGPLTVAALFENVLRAARRSVL